MNKTRNKRNNILLVYGKMLPSARVNNLFFLPLSKLFYQLLLLQLLYHYFPYIYMCRCVCPNFIKEKKGQLPFSFSAIQNVAQFIQKFLVWLCGEGVLSSHPHLSLGSQNHFSRPQSISTGHWVRGLVWSLPGERVFFHHFLYFSYLLCM